EGLARLDTILTRMSEATRLEQLVRQPEREHFDARDVVRGCVSGYASIYPRARFVLSLPENPVMLTGAPDLYAQMLDKLAAIAATRGNVDLTPFIGSSACFRYEPVWLALFAAICSGVPSATRRPPPSPPSGPRSTTQSAVLITSKLCSMTTTVLPASRRRCS